MFKSIVYFIFLYVIIIVSLTLLVVSSSKFYENLSATLIGLLLAYLTWQLSNYLWYKINFPPKELISSKSKAVVITGCDSGFGFRLAKKLNQYGFVVFACCLNSSSDGAKQLKEICESRKNMIIIQLDVTKDADVEEMRRKVMNTLKANNLQLWSVVNNAGILAACEIEIAEMKSFTNQMEVNCIGMIRVTKALLPFIRYSKGRIINIASLAGRFSIPGMVGYCMSKCSVLSFSEGLRREMVKWGVDVITIEPHLFKTNLCNDDVQRQILQNSWNSLLDEVKCDYGEDYLHGFQLLLDKMLNSARSRINHVVETMEIAVTHQYISPTYKVLGDSERIRVWLWSLFPIRVLDFISYFASIQVTGAPKTLLVK